MRVGRALREVGTIISATRPVATVDYAYPTRLYTRTHRLPVRLQLGLLGKCVVGLSLWLDVGLYESPVPICRFLRTYIRSPHLHKVTANHRVLKSATQLLCTMGTAINDVALEGSGGIRLV